MGDGRLMATGIFGGSGSHIVQIIIGIVVVVALIGYFVLRLGGRVGGGDARAVAAAVSQHGEKATSDATLLLVRTWGLAGQSQPWNIVIDGIVVGSIADKETVEVAVEPGHRLFRLESARHRSAERSFDVASGDVVTFRCNSPRLWPLLLAALVKPDLWISLRRENG